MKTGETKDEAAMNREQMIAWLILEGWEPVYPVHPMAASNTSRIRKPIDGYVADIIWQTGAGNWRFDASHTKPPQPDWWAPSEWSAFTDKDMAEIWRLANEP